MNFRHILSCLVLPLFALVSGSALAQIAAGGTTVLIPVVATTASFTSEIVVKDESGASHSVGVKFYESLDSSTPGAKTCSSVSLSPFQVTTFSVATQCGLAGGSHFGFVILTDATQDKWFYGFSRTSNPQGIGFSVEGYPIGHIGGGDPFSEVAGVKRKAATANSPAYQTNCFVATLDDPVQYSISVDDANGSGTVTGTLPAFSMHRYLDIYAAAGLGATGDHDNTTVTFEKTDGSQFPDTLIGFCTVQDNTSFGADFRIAKTLNAADPGQARLNCVGLSFGSTDCSTTLQASAPQVPNATSKVRLVTEIRAPDTVRCSLVSSGVGNLEMRLVRDSDGAVVAGGDNVTSFAYTTGKRSAIGFGFHQYYWIEVGSRTSGSFPIQFGVQCTSGNGIADPLFVDTVPDDF